VLGVFGVGGGVIMQLFVWVERYDSG